MPERSIGGATLCLKPPCHGPQVIEWSSLTPQSPGWKTAATEVVSHNGWPQFHCPASSTASSAVGEDSSNVRPQGKSLFLVHLFR